MKSGKLIKTAIFVLLLVAASSYLGSTGRYIGQLGDNILVLSMDTLYPFLWLLLALVLVAITAGLVATLIRPLWICFIAFALASLAVLFFWGLSLIGAALALLYLLAGLLYSRTVAKELDERIRFSVRPIRDNQTALGIVLVLAVSVLFYAGYSAQTEREGFTVPSSLTSIAMEVAHRQIESMPNLTPEQREQAIAEFKRLFEQQLEEAVKPYQNLIPIAVAIILFVILTTIVRLFSWLPALFLRGIFRILTACHVTSVVTETREIERLTID